jgi:hypothetical protein
VRVSRWIAVLCVWSWLCSGPALACRYNVRDTGFVDLETATYQLYVFRGVGTSAEVVSSIRDRAGAALRDSNISLEIIQAESQTQHAALKYLPGALGNSDLAAVLVSPDGQSLLLRPAQNATGFVRALEAMFSEMTSSPAREAILRIVSQKYAAVLFMEGADPVKNDQARAAIASAIEDIRVQMKAMPKAIAAPPEMLVLSAAALAGERVLLWSLGLSPGTSPEPRAAVIYGRARWVGPLIKGEEISARNVGGILSMIGADCECGLDISWTQGTRLPVLWSDQRQAQVAKSLGFDPENPLIKAEVSRIVGRRGATIGLAQAGLAQRSEAALSVPPAARGGTVLWKGTTVLAGLASIVLLAGLLILVRARRG